jgi:GAF domain-containing protein
MQFMLDDLELARLARTVRGKDGDLGLTLDAVVATAVEVVEPARFASINLMLKGKFSPQAALGQPPHVLDRLQLRLGAGPCIEASTSQSVIHVADTRTDGRWPRYEKCAAQLQVLSMLCAPLWVDEQRVGSLSLYAVEPDAFDARDLRLAELLAVHAALALSDAGRAEKLREAAANRDIIGQAKGVLMERHQLTAAAAFDLLTPRSAAIAGSRRWPRRWSGASKCSDTKPSSVGTIAVESG